MDPITGRLVVHDDGNSMLEPFRRVADSAIPTKPDEFVGHPPFKATSYQVNTLLINTFIIFRVYLTQHIVDRLRITLIFL